MGQWNFLLKIKMPVFVTRLVNFVYDRHRHQCLYL